MKKNKKRVIGTTSYCVLLGVAFLSPILCNTAYCLQRLEALPSKEEIKQEVQHIKEKVVNETQHIKEKIVNEKCKRIVELGKADIIESEKHRPIQQSVAFSVKEIENVFGLKDYLTAHIELVIPAGVYRSNLNVVEDEPLIVVVDNESFPLPFVGSVINDRLAHGLGRDKKIIDADYLLSQEVVSKLMAGHYVGYKTKLSGNNCVFEVKGDFTYHNIENLKKMKSQ